MFRKLIVALSPCLLLLAGVSAFGQQGESGPPGSPTGPRLLRVTSSVLPETLQSQAHKDAAKRLAGSDPVLNNAWNFFCTPTRYNEPAEGIEARKVFDNLYAIPSSPEQQTIVWAITTSQGIILIDSGHPGRTEAIVGDMQKVGLDPADVKFILLGHGHGDHYGGAAYFQERYGTRVGSTSADWDLMDPPGQPASAGNTADARPKRDLVLKEGPFTLGDQTVQIIEIPGHTPGSIAFIFNVKDGSRTHRAGLFGGTILDQPRISKPELNQYLGSIAHFQEYARKMKVDVEIQNHALFDETPARLERLASRQAGEPHPFLMSTEKYTNLWDLVSECIRSEITRRPADAR